MVDMGDNGNVAQVRVHALSSNGLVLAGYLPRLQVKGQRKKGDEHV